MLNHDLESMTAALRAAAANIPVSEMVLRDDVWEDSETKEHWAAAFVEWINDDLQVKQWMVAFELLEDWVSELTEGVHASATIATAIRSSWQTKLQVLPRQGVPPRCPLPAWNFSDNAAPAVAVGKLLGAAPLRCKAHFPAIVARRILHAEQPKAGQRARPHPYPQLLLPYEKMRDIGKYYYNHSDRQRLWTQEKKRQEVPSTHPHFDSHAKWGSTAEMGRHQYSGRSVTAARHAAVGDHPPLLTDADWQIILNVQPALEALEGFTSVVQADCALAGLYLPASSALQNQLGTMTGHGPSAVLQEWRACEGRHIDISPGQGLDSAEGQRWSSERELLECCSLAIPAFRAGTWDNPSEDTLRDRFRRFQTLLWVEF